MHLCGRATEFKYKFSPSLPDAVMGTALSYIKRCVVGPGMILLLAGQAAGILFLAPHPGCPPVQILPEQHRHGLSTGADHVSLCLSSL